MGVRTGGAEPKMKILFFAKADQTCTSFRSYLEGAGHEVLVSKDLRQALDYLRAGGVTVAVAHEEVLLQDAVLLAATMGTQTGRGRLIVMRSEDDADGRKTLEQVGVTEILPASTSRLALSEALTAPASQAPSLTTFSRASTSELSILEKLFGHDKDQVEGRWLLGFAYYRAGEFEDGYEVLAEVVRRDPDRIQARYYLGSCCYRLGRNDEAGAAWEKVLAQAPGTVHAKKAEQHLTRLGRGSEPPLSSFPGQFRT